MKRLVPKRLVPSMCNLELTINDVSKEIENIDGLQRGRLIRHNVPNIYVVTCWERNIVYDKTRSNYVTETVFFII